VTRDESHVSVVGMLALGQRGKKNDRGKERVHKTEVTIGKRTIRAHARKRAQRKLTAG
jgi:hypothetical protein